MKTAFLIYSLDVDGSLNNYWTIGYDHTAPPLILDDGGGQILEEILSEIEGEEDIDDRVLYLGQFNMIPYTIETYDAISIDVSRIGLELFFKKRGLNEKPATSLNHNENAILQSLMMKFITIKSSLSTMNDSEEEEKTNDEKDEQE